MPDNTNPKALSFATIPSTRTGYRFDGNHHVPPGWGKGRFKPAWRRMCSGINLFMNSGEAPANCHGENVMLNLFKLNLVNNN